MVIGIHILEKNNEDYPLFVALKYISNNNPSHSFIFFTKKSSKNLSENCIQIIVSPKPKNRLLVYYWYNYKLPKLLLKYAVSTFITDARMLAPVSTIKQYLFFSNLDFEKDKNIFFKKKTIAALSAAENIFVTNDYVAALLKEKYPVYKNKIEPFYFGLGTEKINISLDEIEATKTLYTNGYDYFLYPVSKSSFKKIITVLKAFSQFKKWQKSSIKLVLLLDNIREENLINDFKNYKYKGDVKIIIQDQENISPIIASAFCLVFFGSDVDVPIAFRGLQNYISVIAAYNKMNNVLFKNAVMYTNVDANDLAVKMQLIYKDESQKNVLIQQAAFLWEKYSSENASSKMFELIAS